MQQPEEIGRGFHEIASGGKRMRTVSMQRPEAQIGLALARRIGVLPAPLLALGVSEQATAASTVRIGNQ